MKSLLKLFCLVAIISITAFAEAEADDTDVCYLKADVGPCRGKFQRWYFNPESGQCENFVYGGCKGNGNNFKTLEECQGQCQSEDVCYLEPDEGLCRGYFPMWYFDQESGQCKEFIYGGCMGNGNRFATLEECQEQCQSKK